MSVGNCGTRVADVAGRPHLPQTLSIWSVPKSFRSPAPAAPRALRADSEQQSLAFHATSLAWSRALATKTSTLDVVVLGDSVAVGCGSSWLDDLLCEAAGGWVRHLKDGLDSLVEPLGRSVRLDVSAKNAIGPDYFMPCLAARLRLDPQVIVLCFESMLQVDGSGLAKLVARLRELVPNAVICYLGWPAAATKLRVDRRAIETMAIREQMDIVHGPLLFDRVNASTTTRMYADAVHPNPESHALLGQAMARLIAKRVRDASCETSSHHVRNMERDSPLRHRENAYHPVQNSSGADEREWCFASAEALPVLSLHNFSLVDEGGAKRVEKLGLISRRIGDRLRLGLPPTVSCGFFHVRLGYLQSWRPTQGAFTLRCSGGCRCAHVPGVWATQSFPFPLVQTSTRRPTQDSEGHWMPAAGCIPVRGTNFSCEHTDVSVTMMTEFALFKPAAEGECAIEIQHVTWPPGELLNESRIRIDSLSFRRLGCQDQCGALLGPYWRHFRRMQPHLPANATRCVKGSEQGLPGFESALCTPSSCNARDDERGRAARNVVSLREPLRDRRA